MKLDSYLGKVNELLLSNKTILLDHNKYDSHLLTPIPYLSYQIKNSFSKQQNKKEREEIVLSF